LINKVGGAALIIDYGENHGFSDSVRAIANHKFLPKEAILNKPGECDISAYVNFLALARAAQLVPGIKVPELIPQGLWLESMGITTRLEVREGVFDEKKDVMLECE
jgi:NADH dehydrogenase [ubiquinone] 1 alpha subcomplex assembly factor 7